MEAFITIVVHFAVCYLHVLFAWLFYPHRQESYSVNIYWLMMVLYAVMHGCYGAGLLFEELALLGIVYTSVVFTSYLILPIVTAMVIPLFIGELTVAPKHPNRVATALLVVSRNSRTVFHLALLVCLVEIIWSVLHFFPLERWHGEYGNIKGLYGLLAIGGVWLLMLASGIRPDERWNELGKALRIFFVFLLAMWSYEYLTDFEGSWSAGPVLMTLGFSFIFSWYRFRLQFMDIILNQTVGMAMLILIAIGLVQLLAFDVVGATIARQYLVTACYLLLAMIAYQQANQWFLRLWAPAEKSRQWMNVELPERLSASESEDEAIEITEKIVGSIFHCEVCINRRAEFEESNVISLAGDQVVELHLGFIRGWIPWLSVANELARVAALYLQNHLIVRESHSRLMQSEELSTLAARAELSAMRAQIRPHFLFNTLNSIHSFVRDEPAKAETVIEQWSELMRSVLTSPDEDTISLEKELHVVSNYLAIEKARYGERLGYDIEIDPGLHCLQLPPFSLQPLVENVVKHAVEGQFEAVSLSLQAVIADSDLVINVTDDGPGFTGSGEGLGIAIKNIRERLARLYGDDASLVLQTNDSGGVTAILTVPVEQAGQGRE